ncbi:MAG: hypothetical protein DSZ05_02750 [Sulfurospirillum sp.]|nr:MAG: hypothetical protein DSZ05_02750 [Sulfurospirillum sp.]
MQKVLGKLILWITISLLSLAADQQFTYHIDISNQHPVVKEAVILTMEFNQTEIGKTVRFSFQPQKSDRYRMQFLEADDNRDFKGRSHIIMKYAIFPLQAAKIDIPLNITLQVASKEELKKFVTGSADELMYLRTENKSYPLPPLKLDVSPLPQGTEVVGDYRLDFTAENNQTGAGKQINVVYTLSGRGYRPDIATLLPPLKGVNTFLATEQFHDKLFHKIIFRYALLSDQNFTIPQVQIPAYSPKKRSQYLLATDKIQVAVYPLSQTRSEKPSLLLQINWRSVRTYADYLLIFLSGFLFYKLIYLIHKQYKKDLSGTERFLHKVKDAKTAKALLQILIASRDPSFHEEIREIEKHIYQNSDISIREIKNKIKNKCLIKESFF